MDKTVIRWKLNEIMAQKRVRNKDLAQGIGVTETSVYRLRKTDEMPRMTPERLNDICKFLNCQPGDLLVFIPDSEGDETVSEAKEHSTESNQVSNTGSFMQRLPGKQKSDEQLHQEAA